LIGQHVLTRGGWLMQKEKLASLVLACPRRAGY